MSLIMLSHGGCCEGYELTLCTATCSLAQPCFACHPSCIQSHSLEQLSLASSKLHVFVEQWVHMLDWSGSTTVAPGPINPYIFKSDIKHVDTRHDLRNFNSLCNSVKLCYICRTGCQ